MLNCLRIKLDEARSHSSESTWKQPRNHIENKQAVEGVRQKIDNTLKKAYQKLRLESRSTIKCTRIPSQTQKYNISKKCLKQANPLEKHVKQISLKRSGNLSANGYYRTAMAKQTQTKMQSEEIVLVDNQDVMAYIQLIYQTYNIRDPLTAQNIKGDVQIMMPENTIEKNKRLGLIFDEQHSLNSARTIKEDTQNNVKVSQFDAEQYDSLKKTTNKKANKIVITLRSNSAQKNYLHLSKEANINPLLAFKDQDKSKTIQENVNPLNKLANNKQQSFDKVATFRYCFACQKSIFQPNILKHESECHELKVAYTFNFDKILHVLEDKIQRIIDRIEKDIVGLSSDQLNTRFLHLQGLIKSWTAKACLNGSSATADKQFRNEYSTIMRKLDTNFYDKFQLLNKLSWFTKLRQNILARKPLF